MSFNSTLEEGVEMNSQDIVDMERSEDLLGLTKALNDPDHEVKTMAIRSLGTLAMERHIGDYSSVSELNRLLRCSKGGVLYTTSYHNRRVGPGSRGC